MAVENQSASLYAGNRHVFQWAGITNEGGTGLLDLTGKIVKVALARKGSSGPVLTNPLIDMRSDVSAQVTIPNPILGSPHVEVEFLPADTIGLAPKETVYYLELEVFEGDGSSPVVVATADVTIKPNVENA